MNYKDIRKKIEKYEKECNTAFYILYDHSVNASKEKLFDDAQNKRTAAISALYDFSLLYKKGELNSDDAYEKYKTDYEKLLDEYIIKEKEKSKKERLITFKKVYFELMDKMIHLPKKDILKVIKYAEQKEHEQSKKERKNQMSNESIFVNSIITIINDLYNSYTQDKINRKNKIFHVGTNPLDIENYIEQITLDELLYNLYYNAVISGINFKDNNKLVSSKLINESFDNIDDKYLSRYTDKDFIAYKKTFKKSYLLSENNRNKLKKSLNYGNKFN